MAVLLGTDSYVLNTKGGGRAAVPDDAKLERAGRVKMLRALTALSQEAFGERGGLARTVIVRIESGDNGASSGKVQESLAKATGGKLTASDIAAFLDKRIDIEEVIRRRDAVEEDEIDPAAIAERAGRLALAASALGISHPAITQVLGMSFKGGLGLTDAQLIANMGDVDQAMKGKSVGVMTPDEEEDESPAVKRSRKARAKP